MTKLAFRSFLILSGPMDESNILTRRAEVKMQGLRRKRLYSNPDSFPTVTLDESVQRPLPLTRLRGVPGGFA
jgi:hypothetical protein